MNPITVIPDVPGRFVQVAVPLRRGMWAPRKGVSPFRVFALGTGGELPSQCERITRYDPMGRQSHASDVMVYADAGQIVSGIRIEFEPHRDTPDREFEYHAAISELEECFPFAPRKAPTMDGPVCVQRRLRLTNLEAWATFFHQSPAIRVEGFWHRGLAGARELYGNMQLEFLNRPLPVDWEVHWVVDEPIGTARGTIGDGQDHFFGQRGVRRFVAVLAPKGYAAWREAHTTSGLGICTHEWQSFGALAPFFLPMADLSWRTSLANDQINDWNQIRAALVNGTPFPPYKKPDGSWSYPLAVRTGVFHPCNATEGGETAGTEIDTQPGDAIIQTGKAEAVLYHMARAFMRCSRDRNAAIRADGEPYTYEDLESEIDTGKIRWSVDDPGRFDKSGSVTLDGSLNWSKQIPQPPSAERTNLLAFECTDWAHRIRSLQWDAALLQLTNNPVSRYLLRMDAEQARMAWKSGNRQFNDVSGGHHQGLGRDRILGWQLWSMSLAYAFGSNELRSRFGGDLHSAYDMERSHVTVQGALCVLQSGKQVTPAPYLNKYGVCVGIHEGLLRQGPYAACRVLGVVAEAMARDGMRAVQWLLSGSPTQRDTLWSAAVYDKATTTPIDPVNLELSSADPSYVGGAYDSEQTRMLLGFYGFELIEAGKEGSNDWMTLLSVITQMLGSAPTTALKKQGTGAWDSDGVLLAFCMKAGLP